MSSSQRSQIKTRFAPSPTGRLHLGGLRTALFSYLLAKRGGGEFHLRIEDTDLDRFDPEATADIISSLKWAGLNWQEPILYQSKRLPLYRDYAHQMMASGHAYRCFCSKERLASLREKNPHQGYDGFCRGLTPEEIQSHINSDHPYVIRLKLPQEGTITITDKIMGPISYPASQLSDAIIVKSDGYPTYHLAHMVDDHFTGITHVLRGQEWLSTYPLHHFIGKALSFSLPEYIHLPLITSEEGGKLSKRNQSVSVREFRQQGYLPESLINFLVLLGWSYDDKTSFFSLEDLEGVFSTRGLSKSHAQFALDKLNHFNNHYLQKLSSEAFLTLVHDKAADLYVGQQAEVLDQVILLYQSRLHHLGELREYLAFYLNNEVDYTQVLKTMPFDLAGLEERLELLVVCLSEVSWNKRQITAELKATAKSHNHKMFDLMMPLRMAVTASMESPSILDIALGFGRYRTLARIQSLITSLSH